MTPERYKQIERLYHSAYDLTPDERTAFLAAACGEDVALRREVEELLSKIVEAGSFLNSPAAENVTRMLPEKSELTLVGKRISHYEIESRLGAGGMGEVYLAADTRLERKVALKVLPKGFTTDPDRVRRFIQEAKAASALNHPNIVTIHDIGESEAGRYIAMEHVRGKTLRAMYADMVSVAKAAKLMTQVAQALSVAHAAGIVHRDIKPDNIMVRDDGYVKVLDFGLARLTQSADAIFAEDAQTQPAAHTSPGMILGTPRYMSPEQARGEVAESASDIFSLGILLYELTTGEHPFTAETPIGFLHAIISQMVLPPARLNPQISESLQSLILRMLEKDDRLRPTADEVVQALEQSADPNLSFSVQTQSSEPRRRLVGREKELDAIRLWFDAAATTGGLLVGIAGEPGLGKTTLVEGFLANLKSSGQVCGIGRGRCSERLAGANAYLPFLESLGSLLSDHTMPYARLMKTLAPTWYAQVASLQPADSSDNRLLADIKAVSQERLKRELTIFLQEASRTRPLILFLDDLHWADESTTDLLSYLAGQFKDLRLLILATYRLSELLLEEHPFQQLKLELQGRGLCHELQPNFLGNEEIEKYLAQEFPAHRFPAEFTEMILTRTEGNPLFMTDLVRYLRDCKVIAEEQGQWTLTQEVEAIQNDLPESVRSMVQRKIDQLEDEDRKLLVGASVQGYEFDAAVVAQALNLDAADVEDKLDELEKAYGLVQMVGEKEFPDRTLTLRYRFVHALYQNALYSSLKPTRRASISKAVAESLLGFHRDKVAPIATRLALLFEAARDFAPAAQYCVMAAKNSMQIAAFKESLSLARRGVELLKALPESEERAQKEMTLQHMIGASVVAVKSGAAPEILPAFLRARELAEQLGDHRMRFKIEYSLVWTYFSRGDVNKALAQSDIAVQLSDELQDSMFMIQARYVKGCLAGRRGQLRLARELFEQAISFFDQSQHIANAFIFGSDGGSHSFSQLARVLWLLGYPDQALVQLDKAFEIAEMNPHPIAKSHVLVDSFSVYSHYDCPQKILELTERMITLCQEKGLAMVVYAVFTRGVALAKLGKQQEGIAIMRQGMASLKSAGLLLTLPSLAVAFAEALTEAGQPEEAVSVADESLKIINMIGERTPEAELCRLKGDALMALASLEADADAAKAKEAEAEACFHQALDVARQQEAKSFELLAAMSLYRLGRKRGQPDEARKLLSEIYSSFTEGFDTPDLKLAKSYLDSSLGDNDNEPPTKPLKPIAQSLD